MVFQKARYELHWKLAEPRGRAGPKGSSEGEKKALLETISEPVLLEEFVNCFHARLIFPEQFVKAQDFKNHFPVKRIGRVAQASEKSSERFTAILEFQAVRTDGKTHPGNLRFDTEQLEKPDEIRVILFVENDKAGIHLVRPGFSRDLDCVYVPTRFGIGFEKREVMLGAEEVSACEARYSRSYDSNFHRLACVVLRERLFL